jgi:hypothetical protein
MLQGEQAEQDAVEAPQPAAHEVAAPRAGHGAVLLRAAQHAVVARPPEAEHAVAERAQEAQEAGVVEERVAEVVRLPEAPGAPVALPSAVLWAAVWAFHRDQALPWPVP